MDILDQNPQNTPTPNDNQMAMWAHLIGLISCMSGFLGLVGTVIFYFVNKEKSTFVKQHATQALNFQIVYFLASIVLGLLFVGVLFGSIVAGGNAVQQDAVPTGLFAGIGFAAIVMGVFFIVNVFICIKSALSANKGEIWNNPLAFPMVR